MAYPSARRKPEIGQGDAHHRSPFGNPDVIVIGAGNAASCAALAAREGGAKVIMLEAAPLEDCGGTGLTSGAVFGKIAGHGAAAHIRH